jgi:hypothetical protein
MKSILAALASASLLAAPLTLSATAASARGFGGFHGGGSGFHGGSFRGAGARDGGFAGRGFRDHGFRDRGFRGDGLLADELLFDDDLFAFALADPWYFDDVGYYDGYVDGPPEAASFGPSRYQDQPPAQASQKACGSWVWDAGQDKYNWVANWGAC